MFGASSTSLATSTVMALQDGFLSGLLSAVYNRAFLILPTLLVVSLVLIVWHWIRKLTGIGH